MANIELVIKIPKMALEYAKQYNKSCSLALDMNSVCINAIANGTPLEEMKKSSIEGKEISAEMIDVVALDFSDDIDTPNKYQTADGKWHTGRIPTTEIE